MAVAFGATASLHYQRTYPATINSPRHAEFAAGVAADLVGNDKVTRDLPLEAVEIETPMQPMPGSAGNSEQP